MATQIFAPTDHNWIDIFPETFAVLALLVAKRLTSPNAHEVNLPPGLRANKST